MLPGLKVRLPPTWSVPSPTSEERRGNGYHGAMMWLDEEAVRTVSVRERFDQWLGKPPGTAATGNLLIVTLPVETAFRTEELRPLIHSSH